MDNLIVGRYINGNSFIHKLDPRNKFLSTFFFICIIFLADNWLSYLVLAIFVGFSLFLSDIPFSFYLKGLKPMLWLILFTVFLQVLFTPTAHPIWHWGIFSISKESIINGCYIFMRFTLIIFFSTLLTLTTTPIELSDAIEYILNPLKKIKFPVAQFSLMLSISLRFVPLLTSETSKIMNAQRSRGVDFESGNIIKRIRNFVPLLIPLFVSSFSIAADLAVAMESRGYQDGQERTKFRQLIWHKIDTLSALSMVVLTLILIAIKVFYK